MWLVARLKAFRPMRAWTHYSLQHGPLMSAGIGFNMFFSIFSLLATGFSVAALVLAGNPALIDQVVHSVAKAAPGLLKVDGGDGVVDPKSLLNPTGLSVTAIISILVAVFSSLGWITSLRDGLRGVVQLPPLKVNPVLLKVRDIGTLLLLGVLLIATSGVSIIFTAAVGYLAGLVGIDGAFVAPVGWLIGLLVPLLLNVLTAFVLFRLAGGLRLGRRALLEGVLLAGIGTSVLQAFSTQLLARAGANPLLASFAIIIGLLIWFNLVSQVYLVSASWSAIREADITAAAPRRVESFGSARPHVRPSAALVRGIGGRSQPPARALVAPADDGARAAGEGRRRASGPLAWLGALRPRRGDARAQR
ncbi:YihY/virulence factor BrkB family protein [Sinomonas sp. JC656]|uniref:YihY/virulence factor BrkB family protein n=2 Tax=Sinomonas cellulolyticus TaxID=2801916 RepID=A0ABS1JZG4_9MICC|nr:YihY/virulence factor BrkB family protein [Sinomonas cellulolyticus]